MAGICRNVVRTAVITGIVGTTALGAAVAVAGPDRVGAFLTQARSGINNQIDKCIKDPVALRAQLRDLQEQYPQRIGAVRSDLAQLHEQVAQLNRDLSVSTRVVEMADEHSEKLSMALDQAQAAGIQNVAFGENVEHQYVIVFKNDRLSPEQAQVRLNHVHATRNAYAQRAADIQRDLGYLAQQEQQLTSLLGKLETEQTAFQTQLFDLDRQIDAVARNDRMIDVMASRQRTLDEQSRYRAASLDQITGKLADIRAKQEARLAALTSTTEHFSYEEEAKSQLDREAGVNAGKRTAQLPPAPKVRPTVIEINPDKALPPAPKAKDVTPLASNSPAKPN